MILLRLLFATVAWIGWSCSAGAQWVTHTQEDPFRGNETAALTSEGVYSLGFVCTKADDLMMLFVVPEKHDARHDLLLSAPFKMLVIVDDQPKVTLDARAQVVPSTGWYRFVAADADDVAPLMKAVASAKRRVAVAVEMLGELAHSKQFTVSGSGRALGKLLANCKLPT